MSQLYGVRKRVVESNEDRQLEDHRKAAGQGVQPVPTVKLHHLLLERHLVVLVLFTELRHLWLNLLHFPHVTECRQG